MNARSIAAFASAVLLLGGGVAAQAPYYANPGTPAPSANPNDPLAAYANAAQAELERGFSQAGQPLGDNLKNAVDSLGRAIVRPIDNLRQFTADTVAPPAANTRPGQPLQSVLERVGQEGQNAVGAVRDSWQRTGLPAAATPAIGPTNNPYSGGQVAPQSTPNSPAPTNWGNANDPLRTIVNQPLPPASSAASPTTAGDPRDLWRGNGGSGGISAPNLQPINSATGQANARYNIPTPVDPSERAAQPAGGTANIAVAPSSDPLRSIANQTGSARSDAPTSNGGGSYLPLVGPQNSQRTLTPVTSDEWATQQLGNPAAGNSAAPAGWPNANRDPLVNLANSNSGTGGPTITPMSGPSIGPATSIGPANGPAVNGADSATVDAWNQNFGNSSTETELTGYRGGTRSETDGNATGPEIPTLFLVSAAMIGSLMGNLFQWFNILDLRNKYRVALRRTSPTLARSLGA